MFVMVPKMKKEVGPDDFNLPLTIHDDRIKIGSGFLGLSLAAEDQYLSVPKDMDVW